MQITASVLKLVKYIILAAALASCGTSKESTLGANAKTFEFLLSQVRASGAVLSGGKVYFYVAGTETPKTVWQDRGKTTEAANPYTLDANGTAQVFGDGLYRVVIKDASLVTKYDWDNISIRDISGNVYDVADYASINAAVTAIGGTRATLQYATDQTLTSNLSLPSTLQLKPQNGAIINHGSYTVGGDIDITYFPKYGRVFNGTGAVTGLPESHPEWFGIDGINDGIAIRKAIASTDGPVHLTRQYIVKLDKSITLEGGATVCSIIAKSNMHLVGVPGVATVKLADNESTDASPKYFNIIAGNTALDNITIEGITFDINGANNKISPLRGSNTYNRFNCAAFMVSGSVATVGIDARLTNFKFLHNIVKNGPGATSIGLAQSNSAGSVLGSNIEIAYNTFYNNGIDTDDHSSLYLWADNVKVHHNTFSHPAMSSGVAGPLVAVELHGSNNSFTDNDVTNYYQGVWRAGNLTARADNQTIANNRFKVAVRGIGEFVESATEPGIGPCDISNNIIVITGDYPSIDPGAKVGVGLTPSYGSLGAKVNGNTITSLDTTRLVQGVAVGVISNIHNVKNVQITNNTLSGFPVSISLGTVNGGTVDEIDVSNNHIVDVKATTAVPTFTFGISISGRNGRIRLKNNDITTRTGPLYAGIYTDPIGAGTGTISDLYMEGNAINNFTNYRIWDNSIVREKRTGRQALDATTTPVNGIWDLGDRIANLAGVVGQPKAWQCTTSGGAKSTTRANTTAYSLGIWATWTTGTTVWEVTTAGTTTGAAPSIVGKVVGDTVSDGSAVWTMRSLTTAVFTSEGNL